MTLNVSGYVWDPDLFFWHWMIEKWLDDCFEVSLKRQGRDVGHRNSVVAELIGPFPSKELPVSCCSRTKSFLGGGIRTVSRGFSGALQGPSVEIKPQAHLDELRNVYTR